MTNKKSQDTATAEAFEAAADVAAENTADQSLAVAHNSGQDALAIPAELMMELRAEIEADLKAISIDVLSSARSMLGKTLTLHDAFLTIIAGFATPEKGDNGDRIIFEVTDENGVAYSVAQNPIGSRLTFVNIYNNLRKVGRKLNLTNVEFKEVGTAKFGNKPIILATTSQTEMLFN